MEKIHQIKRLFLDLKKLFMKLIKKPKTVPIANEIRISSKGLTRIV